MQEQNVHMVKISSIKVVIPRSRNKFRHAEITESIDASGLRKPITIRKIVDKKYDFALICGQGRLESLTALGEELIPAFILDIDENQAYIMSLVENMARVIPRAGEQFQRIKEMTDQGLTNKEISNSTGLSLHWITSLTMLINKGENKLLSAVESGSIPISFAVEIARVDFEGGQELLIKAFDEGLIKHKDVGKVRELLDSRDEGLKGFINNNFGVTKKKKKMTTDELQQLYQDNISQHKKIKNKADYVEIKLLVASQIFKELTSNESFYKIVNEESLQDIVKVIVKNTAN
ncbi:MULTISPECIES: ParB/RepB/Spo0J family partition protein [Enterobacterales]|jgi:ParB family chromosome partitioning protein|uniref:Chromosome partitioning protein ParB n=2 Tax=Enterobacterales TaxID=91347 RepID=A0A2A2MB37_9GAMM|nr:ParB N-terminal domain-containing protein [Hafnia paralvei]EKN3361109.1 ParB N-terminal domain-containing protein [Yersinia ruckeri]EKN4202352.1 ParB N-terminal domain-containing protein [Yersinia ruckeri]EKN4724966.1 ParB N-terminal domain-containing protein [Yersinia ruckeri]ELV7521873.1 ParB N-terminal domain-containing protein [Yersinia ruckeri]KHS43928.1 chromosome partitioning protein ParB [Hafnia paralvei]